MWVVATTCTAAHVATAVVELTSASSVAVFIEHLCQTLQHVLVLRELLDESTVRLVAFLLCHVLVNFL